MGYYSADEADKYGGGGSSFFSLKNDKDIAERRYCYDDVDQIRGIAVHEIQINGNRRVISCNRNYNDPVDKCPLCAAGYPVKAKFFVTLWDDESQEYEIWERGKTYLQTVAGLAARYHPLVATRFEIERQGKAGSTDTKYMNYPLEHEPGTDDITLADLPEPPEVLGTIVLDKSNEAIEYFLDNGEFMEEGEQALESRRRNPATDTPPATSRRTEGTPPRGASRARPAAPEATEVPEPPRGRPVPQSSSNRGRTF